MPELFDLNILPLSRRGGQDLPDLPGLYMVTPPRRAARGRSSDRLVIFFTPAENTTLAAQQQEQLLIHLAQTYYKTSGSITSALRSVAEALNQFLLERNLRSSSSGQQYLGLLSLAALREARLYLAQCGPVHAYHIAPQETRELFDPQGGGRGLGIARTVTIRYYQVELQPNDYLVLAAQPPPGWSSITLQGARSQGMESLRRRLLTHAGPDLKATVIQVQGGTGKLRLLRAKAASPMAVAPGSHVESEFTTAELTQAPPPKASAPIELIENPRDFEQANRGSVETVPFEPRVEESHVIQLPEHPTSPADSVQPPLSGSEAPIQLPAGIDPRPPEADIPPGYTRFPPGDSEDTEVQKPDGTGVADFPSSSPAGGQDLPTRISNRSFSRLLRGSGAILRAILPDSSLFTIPPSLMVFFALAVPILIVAVAATVYFQRGRASQYQVYMDQARESAQEAISQTDPLEIRTDWEIALDYLNKAESFLTTQDSRALRLQARSALDELDGVERLEFQPAIAGGLGSSVVVSRMVATATDLYLLNAAEGNVLRAELTGQRGYEIDPNFQCGPGVGIGPLIDIVPLPTGNNQKASIMGMDANGNLLTCIPDSPPLRSSMAPPSSNWGAPMAFTLDTGDVYVLDPQTNAVWIYRGQNFGEQPRLFFGDQVPFMQDVIDLAVNRSDLYLLHNDGRLTTCTYSGLQESPTRCEDPSTFTDPRPGRENTSKIGDAQFQQILFTPPPDPSIYLLDPANQAIYHFSLRLTLQRQFRAMDPLAGGNATAFAISPNRTVLIAAGNQVVYANLP